MVDAQSILMLQETYITTLVFLPMWYWDKTTAPSLLSQAGWGLILSWDFALQQIPGKYL